MCHLLLILFLPLLISVVFYQWLLPCLLMLISLVFSPTSSDVSFSIKHWRFDSNGEPFWRSLQNSNNYSWRSHQIWNIIIWTHWIWIKNYPFNNPITFPPWDFLTTVTTLTDHTPTALNPIVYFAKGEPRNVAYCNEENCRNNASHEARCEDQGENCLRLGNSFRTSLAHWPVRLHQKME